MCVGHPKAYPFRTFSALCHKKIILKCALEVYDFTGKTALQKKPIMRRLKHTLGLQLVQLLWFVGAEPVDWSKIPAKKAFIARVHFKCENCEKAGRVVTNYAPWLLEVSDFQIKLATFNKCEL